jgi:predicted TIM-barrel fold metal-dependent hydrolase
MERERMLLLIDFECVAWSDASVDWEGVHQLCEAFPALNVLMCGIMVAAPANYRGLLEKHSNLNVEISQMASPGEIPRLIEAGFADRIVFGTGLPIKHPGSILTMLQKENISEENYKKIVSGNISRLSRSTVATITVRQPTFKRPERVIDTHTHLGAWNHSASGNGDADSILAQMNRCGIDSAVLTSIWSCYGEVALGNEYVARACEKHPGRFYGYLTVDPKYPEEVRNETRKYADNASFVGVKLHCGLHGYTLTGTEAHSILEHAD